MGGGVGVGGGEVRRLAGGYSSFKNKLSGSMSGSIQNLPPLQQSIMPHRPTDEEPPEDPFKKAGQGAAAAGTVPVPEQAPCLVASGSADGTITIWSIKGENKKPTQVAILSPSYSLTSPSPSSPPP